MTSNDCLKLGVAGLGTVGASVVQIVQEQAEMLATRSGQKIQVTAVTARDKDKDRGFSMDGITWADTPLDLANDPNVDVVVELIGGEEGIAKDLVEQSLKNGKHVVTANKALLAHHGASLFDLAKDQGKALAFEAAVAGGIPIIKAVREGLAANHFSAIYGILNGTCNYILTEMWQNGLDFDVALEQAQEAGYAEADPSFDIDGIDAGHKLAILSALAFTGKTNFDNLDIEGLRSISALDINYADELGYRIKLLGIARNTPDGVVQTVSPCMIPAHTNLASIEGATNAVFVEGDNVGPTLHVGAGAGGAPTASAVIADILDIARGHGDGYASYIETEKYAPFETRLGRFYLRLIVKDQPGVMADVTAILRDHDVSLKSILQYGHKQEESVPLVLTTHETKECGVRNAIAELQGLDSILEEPCCLRVELLGENDM